MLHLVKLIFKMVLLPLRRFNPSTLISVQRLSHFILAQDFPMCHWLNR